MTMITPSYLGETIEYSSLHACRSTLEDPTALDTADLAEPLKPACLHKIARIFGVRRIISFHSTVDKTGVKTEFSVEDIAAQDTWRTSSSNQFRTDWTVGRRKLKPEEIALVNADSILSSMGIKSHLSDNLHLEVTLPAIAANSGGKAAPAPKQDTPPQVDTAPPPPDDPPVAANTSKPDKTKPPKGRAAATTKAAPPHDTVAPGSQANGKSADPPIVVDGNTGNTGASDTGSAISGRPAPVQQNTGAGQGAPVNPNKGARRNSVKDPTAFSITQIPNETQPGSSDTPVVASTTSQASVEENKSNAEVAHRYRQSGDLASTILYLRRAVDDKPDDVALRRELIATYQEVNANELAVAEIGRSLRLDDKNGALYRLYGDARYAEGKLPEALTAYHKAVDLDPKDVASRLALGDALVRDGQFEAALLQYREAATASPTSPLPHRKLALAACQRASSDPAQYAEAAAEIKKSRAVGAALETEGYVSLYVPVMKIMESRLTDILDQLDSTYASAARGSSDRNNTTRIIKDMAERAAAAADFLDSVPAAAGQDGTHALYQEGTASVVSCIAYLKMYVVGNDTRFEDKLKTERMSARHDLTSAGKRLAAIKLAN